MRPLLVLAVVAAAGACTIGERFHECNVDADCAGRMRDGGDASEDFFTCTPDHLCVLGLDSSRLCKLRNPDVPAGRPRLDVGALFRIGSPDDAPKDRARLNALDLALAEVNQENAQYAVALVTCDVAGPDEQLTHAVDLLRHRFGVGAVVGPPSVGGVLALATTTLAGDDVLVMSPAATSAALDALSPLVWRTALSDVAQARVMASPAFVPDGAVIDVVQSDTQSQRQFAHDFAMELGKRPLAPHATILIGDTYDAAAVATQVANDHPTVVAIFADSDIPPLLSAMGKVAGLAGATFILPGTGETNKLFADDPTNPVLKNVKGVGNEPPQGPVYDAFAAAYGSMFTQPDDALATTTFEAQTYDAFYLLVMALASLPDGERGSGAAVARQLRQLTPASAGDHFDGYTHLVPMVAHLRDRQPMTLAGASGPLAFDATQSPASGLVQTWAVDTTTTPGSPTLKATGTIPYP